MDGPHHIEELLDDHGSQTQRQLVDHQQLRARQQRLCECQHLLLAAREVSRFLCPPLTEHGEEAKGTLDGFLDVAVVLLVEPAGEAEVLLDGQPGEHTPAAGHEDHAAGRRLLGPGHGDVAAVVDDGAR